MNTVEIDIPYTKFRHEMLVHVWRFENELLDRSPFLKSMGGRRKTWYPRNADGGTYSKYDSRAILSLWENGFLHTPYWDADKNPTTRRTLRLAGSGYLTLAMWGVEHPINHARFRLGQS